MAEDILLLLKKYREFLVLFYVSLKQDQFDSALSLIPELNCLQEKIHSSLEQMTKFDFDNEDSIVNLAKKILLVQKHIEKLYTQKKYIIETQINDHFYTKIDFLIKKFLQEKGL